MPNICEKGLFGRLYLADYNYYEIYESHMSSSKYIKRSNFPLPEGIETIIQQLIVNEYVVRVKIKHGKKIANRIIPLVQSDLTELRASEKDFMSLTGEDKIRAVEYMIRSKKALEDNGAIVLLVREGGKES